MTDQGWNQRKDLHNVLKAVFRSNRNLLQALLDHHHKAEQALHSDICLKPHKSFRKIQLSEETTRKMHRKGVFFRKTGKFSLDNDYNLNQHLDIKYNATQFKSNMSKIFQKIKTTKLPAAVAVWFVFIHKY